jgi:hypothetical protein
MRFRSTTGLLLAMLCIAGCGERAQEIGSSPAKKADAKPWDTAPGPYAAADWKGGDQAAWEAQMRIRAQGQNEYSRSAATALPAPAKAP